MNYSAIAKDLSDVEKFESCWAVSHALNHHGRDSNWRAIGLTTANSIDFYREKRGIPTPPSATSREMVMQANSLNLDALEQWHYVCQKWLSKNIK